MSQTPPSPSFPRRRESTDAPAAAPNTTHLPWTRSANIYEVNIRQYTPEGTLNAFAAHLPRLRKMGVDILWLMPIQPIGQVNRKGGLGSYYAIRDYTAVNPEFGTVADFKRLVAQAHALGFKLILDWVANHTAWDHPWTATHKHFYKLNEQGEVFAVTFNAGTPQVEYWTDVVGLNYKTPALWDAMIEAMAFWVKEADIDSFRGATWISLHNGGGVGWGEVLNGGFGLVLDGSADADRRLKSMLLWDVNNGIARRSWARNPEAIFAIKREMARTPGLKVTLPNLVADDVMEGFV